MQRNNGLKWDEDDAREAVRDFHVLLGELEAEYPQCVKRIRAGWMESYLRCGHKRLGRLVVGRTPEEACAKRQQVPAGSTA